MKGAKEVKDKHIPMFLKLAEEVKVCESYCLVGVFPVEVVGVFVGVEVADVLPRVPESPFVGVFSELLFGPLEGE